MSSFASGERVSNPFTQRDPPEFYSHGPCYDPSPMDAATERKNEVLLDTLRRFVRRGSRASIVKLLGKVRPEDVAVVMRGLTPAERSHVFHILIDEYPDSAGDVLTELEAPQRNELLERLSTGEIAAILDLMELDDAVFVVDSMPEELRERVRELERRIEERKTGE